MTDHVVAVWKGICFWRSVFIIDSSKTDVCENETDGVGMPNLMYHPLSLVDFIHRK